MIKPITKSDSHTSNEFETEETICDTGELMNVEDFMEEDIKEDVIKK